MSGAVIWITGMPSSGKSTFALLLAQRLRAAGVALIVLDGDSVRSAVVPEFGYSAPERENFYRTLANLAVYFESQNLFVLVPATAHQRRFREFARSRARRFLEVFVRVPQAVVEERDAKGLYQAVKTGVVSQLPGGDLAYEEPVAPDVIAEGGLDSAALLRITELMQKVG